MANALTIAGSDSVGGAGLQADLKAFEAVGVHGCSVVTCVTSQNTKGVSSIFQIPLSEVASQLDSVLEDVRLDAVKTGMLYSAEIVGLVAKKLDGLDAPLVVDPVMAATTGSPLHRSGFVQALISKLLPTTTLVTPNLLEASMLTGIKVKDKKSARKAAEEILEMGPDAVLVKGGHLKGPESADYLVTAEGMAVFSTPRVASQVHGTGCAMASIIAANLALGASIEDSVRSAKVMTYKAILAREKVGKGVPCANPTAVLRIEAQKATMLEELEAAWNELEGILDSRLLPEVGSNMGFAVLGAMDPSEVAAFDGRIVRVGERAQRTGCPRFGASKHVARIVLAASAKDPEARCALNVRYSKEALLACKKARLSVSTFDRAEEPKSVSSMTWGVAEAIDKFGRVPDIIYDEGGVGKEPMIRILGRSPVDVVAKLKRLAGKL